MARKKMNLQWISNPLTRRATYKKRCKGLMKKTNELTTLCGIKASVVVYREGETQPEVWPNELEARHVLEKFKAMPEIGRFKKMQSQEDFIRDRISKLHDQVYMLDLANREHETSRLLHESMDGRRPGLIRTTIEELTNLSKMVETKMTKVKELQGWPTDLALNAGEHGVVVSNGFASSSGGCAGPSGYGGDMTPTYNLGLCLGLAGTQDVFPNME